MYIYVYVSIIYIYIYLYRYKSIYLFTLYSNIFHIFIYFISFFHLSIFISVILYYILSISIFLSIFPCWKGTSVPMIVDGKQLVQTRCLNLLSAGSTDCLMMVIKTHHVIHTKMYTYQYKVAFPPTTILFFFFRMWRRCIFSFIKNIYWKHYI